MNIALYLKKEIIKFKLPSEVSGSFSFDALENSSKLINIDAVNGKWLLHKTDDVQIQYNGKLVNSIEVIPDNFYVLIRENIKYLIFISDRSFNSTLLLSYDFIEPLIISSNPGNGIEYNCPYITALHLEIGKLNGHYVIKKDNNNVYLNNNLINDSISFNDGDIIEAYGFRLEIIKNMLLIKAYNKGLNINYQIIKNYNFPELEERKKFEIKDVDLYKEDDYFNKSPRIRRNIEEKTIKFDKPPTTNDSELPMLITIGPMITMGAISAITFINLLSQISSGTAKIETIWPQLLTSIAMILAMILWPLISKMYTKHLKKKKNYEMMLKYAKYLDSKKEELGQEAKLQSIILFENLITVDECLKNISTKSNGFWSKRLDQDDFLVVRLGLGREKLHTKIEYPEEGFTLEESELKQKADEVVNFFKYLEKVPLSYNFAKNKLTNITGERDKVIAFINNIIVQLISFYSYDDLKIVMFTNEINELSWDYLKYLNHSYNNDKSFRYFASSNDNIKRVNDILSAEVSNRMQVTNNKEPFKPHYLIIVDDYDKIKQYDLINKIAEADDNLGFSIIFLENSLSKLPSKCNNFINIGLNSSEVLCNAFDKQEHLTFNNEIHYDLNMMSIVRQISNLPVESENSSHELPDSITFLEMEKVGKVEQLNILNRWRNNDPTRSLAAEIGVDSQGNLMFLDLHEKFHGPHGLIAGMTGSGKSEFIITYVLSMAMNYSPDEVSFILIDYKGGGLAGAFENTANNIILPHLAGTITNLDKAEMDRTLVSINSELERRQKLFNAARDALGESTIDIYKYQEFYRDGRIAEPIPHLFIICDEFAELKSQQPEFMDSLISTARIGRSLGVHLILATQKPSGVVNDQIWSNTKFRVCLKVQDASDSKEMLKKDDAAFIKEIGRFYLQVGYDEYYALGQSAWCGAKYYPADKMIKQVNKSVDFVNECGLVIKTIQEGNANKVAAQGEQITAILKYIINVARQVNTKAKRLWLPNIPEMIKVDDIVTKYQITKNNIVSCVLGEYDAPEKQLQGPLIYDYLNDGNTIIYGIDGVERELLLSTMIYATAKNNNANKINYYLVDYGSESLRRYANLPQMGGMVFNGEEEKFANLLKLIKEEIEKRKKILINYGGNYNNYIEDSNNNLPIICIILNNYDSIYEGNQNLYDDLPELVRDSERYGIIFIISANSVNSVPTKTAQNFNNIYAFHLKDKTDYSTVFSNRVSIAPRDIFGRGLFKGQDNTIHEFQTCHIVDDDNLNNTINSFIDSEVKANNILARKIPILPEIVRAVNVNSIKKSLSNIPIGISKKDLNIMTVDYTQSIGNIITANRIAATKKLTISLLEELNTIPNFVLIVFDPQKYLNLNTSLYKNYYEENIDHNFELITNYITNLKANNSNIAGLIVINGLEKTINLLNNISRMTDLVGALKKYEHISLLIIDDVAKIKNYNFDEWFKDIFNTNNGLWIGRGICDQSLLHVSTLKKEMLADIKNDMGYVLSDGYSTLTRYIDFVTQDGKENKDEE
jgi:DNA segregation ATPase FtsK/SpoIIIE, S-DNA-T family